MGFLDRTVKKQRMIETRFVEANEFDCSEMKGLLFYKKNSVKLNELRLECSVLLSDEMIPQQS